MSSQIFGKGSGDKPEATEAMTAFSKPNTRWFHDKNDSNKSKKHCNPAYFTHLFF